MNIVHVTPSVSRLAGGLYNSVRYLAAQQLYTASQLHVLSCVDEFTEEDLKSWEPVNVSAHKTFGPKTLKFSPRIASDLHVLNPDLIHGHGIWTSLSSVIDKWSRKSQRPYIISPRGMLDPWALKNSYWKKRIAGFLYENSHLRRATIIHALCDSEAHSIRSFGLKNPISIVPNGVHLPSSPPNSLKKRRSEKSLSRYSLLYLGRIHPKKGLVNLLHGWRQAQRQSDKTCEWELVIAGWDQLDYESKLQLQVVELGLENCVRFIGPQFGQDKDTIFRQTDAFILPSFSEGLPMVVLEAWAYGLPVLMTPECNLPEGFATDSAIRIETDSQSISCGLGTLFSMSDYDRQQMGLQGRRLVEAKYTWPIVEGQLSDVYRLALGGVVRGL